MGLMKKKKFENKIIMQFSKPFVVIKRRKKDFFDMRPRGCIYMLKKFKFLCEGVTNRKSSR